MEFVNFKNRVIGKDEKNQPKAAVGLISYIPMPSDDDPNIYEYAIERMITIKKPEVNIIYISDPFETHEFLQLELKFMSAYDPDLEDTFHFIDEFIAKASQYYDNPINCPAFSITVMPADIYKEDDKAPFMEFLLPMMVTLSASQPNRYPDTIKILFDVDNCSIHEETTLDKEIARKEYFAEIEDEKRKQEEDKMKTIKQKGNEAREQELSIKMHNQKYESEKNILVGRAAKKYKEENVNEKK